MSTSTVSRNRPTSDPGGCECEMCGAIFIGGPTDTVCGICVQLIEQQAPQEPQQ